MKIDGIRLEMWAYDQWVVVAGPSLDVNLDPAEWDHASVVVKLRAAALDLLAFLEFLGKTRAASYAQCSEIAIDIEKEWRDFLEAGFLAQMGALQEAAKEAEIYDHIAAYRPGHAGLERVNDG
jgi:hypothetical protein